MPLAHAASAAPASRSGSAADVYRLLLLDCLLYAALMWYLDQVRLPGGWACGWHLVGCSLPHACRCGMGASQLAQPPLPWPPHTHPQVMPSDVGQRMPWAFPLSPAFWRERWGTDSSSATGGGAPGPSHGLAHGSSGSGGEAAVRVLGLRKVFRTTDGMDKVAVDGLSLDIPRGQVTALLGHNGAGKSTTISILSGLLQPSGGDALFFPLGAAGGGSGGAASSGLSIRRDMRAIRSSLGVCPQARRAAGRRHPAAPGLSSSATLFKCCLCPLSAHTCPAV